MKSKKTTSVELVQELTARNTNGKYDAIIERAKNNGYHDYKFDLNSLYEDCICPKTELHAQLSAFPELRDIRDAVANGDYDEIPDEADNEMMRGWLMEDGEAGKRMIDVLELNKKIMNREMKSLQEVFIAELLRHKFGDTFGGKKKEFDHYPTNKELISFSDECDVNDVARDFDTTIHIEKHFKIINNE